MQRKRKIALIIVAAVVAVAAIAAGGYFLYMKLRKKRVEQAEAEMQAQNAGGKNLAAFLAMIRHAESGNRYNVIVGGQTFSDYSDHPRKKVVVTINGTQIPSTAAGAYQFIAGTWDMAKRNLGLPDFTPASQDKAAIWLLEYRGALEDVQAGDFEAAVRKASKEWASLTYSTANQNPKSLAALKQVYEANGGTYFGHENRV